MEVLCEICKSRCMLLDGEYICQEGHISKYVQEMTENTDYVKISKSLKKKKEENLYEDLDDSYKLLLMYNLLFSCTLEILGLKDEKYFQYFVNFLSGDKEEVFYDIKLDYRTFVILLYLTQREVDQAAGRVLFYRSFVEGLPCLKDRIKHFKQLLVFREFNLTKNQTENWVFRLEQRREILDILGQAGSPINSSENQIYKETGFRNPQVEYNKMCFRTGLRLDLEYMMKYFRVLVDLFQVEPTSEMIFYFEKFVYMREYEKGICFPEDEVCFFLFLMHPETLLDPILDFLGTTPDMFKSEVQRMLYRSGCNGHSRFFFGTFFNQKVLLEKRFYTLEIYLKRLKNLLKNKKNLKIKKEYVDSNMI